jgi:ABC-type dipeptide/oligopeptide/nickel transport system permease subunit
MTKLWLFASVALGALVGAALGLRYGNFLVDQVCSRPDAGNLCGLTSAPAVPFWILIGAVAGASAAALTIIAILRWKTRA